MRTFIFFISIQCLFTITACSKSEQADNSVPKLIWKTPLLDGKESFSFSPVVYKEWVIYGVKYARLDHFEKPKVVAFNRSTGEKVWEWNDAQSNSEYYSADDDTYLYENIFIVSTGANVYAIDLNTGKSLWKTQAPESGNTRLLGVGDKVYHLKRNLDKKKDVLVKANVRTGNWEDVYTAKKENKIAIIDYFRIINKDEDGKTYLYFSSIYANLEYTEAVVHLMKLNTETDTIVFEKILPREGGSNIHAVDDKRIYLGGLGKIIAYNKTTGEESKSYILPGYTRNFTYGCGNFIVKNNKIFAPTNYPSFMCFDKENTNILWSEDGISTSVPSRLLYHDGVVYYTSGSDGNLHAIDENGKRLWKAVSPDRKGSGDGIFDSAITIDKGENRLYVSTYYNACCYETIKK